MKNFINRANELKDEFIKDRRYLHQHAEVGDDLPVTTKYVLERLSELGLEAKEISKSGVVATIEGGKPGPTILLRADTDALPMKEMNNLSFASQTEYAHTCGHDLHTAMLIGAAKMLLEKKENLCGKVRLMFQPAEEIFTGSAAMIENGLLDEPIAVAYDMHVMTDSPLGLLGTKTGFVSSACDGFKITIIGKGCHGAQPHNGVDPINVAAHLHLALQELVAREAPPTEIVALTIGQLVAGTTPNIIPETAVLQGTMRTYNKELRAKLQKRFKEIVEYTAKTFGATAQIEVLSDVPSIYSNPEVMAAAIEYIDELDYDFTLDHDYLVTASDDFARVADRIPSIFIAVGAAPYEIDKIYPNHNPNVIFNEDCLPIGAALFAQFAYRWLEDHQQ